jgi:hypothetical protein
MKTDPRVDAYIRQAVPFAQPILTHRRKLVHRADPEAEEAIKWQMPMFVSAGRILCAIPAFKAHCAFIFWRPGSAGVFKDRACIVSRHLCRL